MKNTNKYEKLYIKVFNEYEFEDMAVSQAKKHIKDNINKDFKDFYELEIDGKPYGKDEIEHWREYGK